jgi:beta-glucosidase-like glycosyl hydrolase
VETTSEDPLINGLYGALHSQGLQQGVDPRYKQAIITLKHWDAYSLEDSDGFTRHNFDAIVSPFALANSYQPAFKRAVIDGEASGVMCSYNSVNGKPTCANEELVATLRGEWGFTGYLTSDSAAVEDIWTSKAKGGHEYVKTKEEGACVAIRNGTTDVCSGTTYHDALLQSVAAGLCSREDVNAALRRTFTVRMQLGLFDPAENQPYFHMGMDTVGTPATIEARRISTLEGQVLLKNAGGALPFPKGGKIAVIGPHGRATLAMAGNYLGQLCPDNKFECIQSPFDAITAANAGGSVTFTLGCNITGTDASGIPAAVDAASAADRVVLFLGIDGTIEGESNDRDSIDLPSIQHQLAAAVAGAGKPTAIVLFHAGSLDISAELGNAAIAAIVEAGYPGVVGGAGVAATLLGDNDRLGGKLSYTVYPASYVNQIKMSEMELDVGVGRGYRYYTGTPVLPFGFGLAFTTFSFSTLAAVSAGTQTGLRLRTEPDGWGVRRVGDGGGNGPAFGESIMMSVNVTNTGAVTGDTVVQAFLTPTAVPAYTLPAGRLPLIKQLFGYQRVHLAPGETVTVNIPVTAATFRLDDRITGKTLSLPGGYTVTFTDGSGSGDQAVSVELY